MIVGLVPAAGYALRLQPLRCSKEVLEVSGRPVIDFLVERMRAAGASEVRVITRPEKEDVVAYAERAGARIVEAHPETINESFAAGMQGLAGGDIALLGFPDSLWEPVHGYRPLVEAVERGEEIALGLFDVPGLVGSDFLTLDEDGRVTGFHIKPENPPSGWIWGCAAARVRALHGIERLEWPSLHMEAAQRRGARLVAIPLSDAYLDIGTHASLERLESSRWAGQDAPTAGGQD